MADTKKIDPKSFIPIDEAFDIISFGVKSIEQTAGGLRNAFKERLQVKDQIKKDRKIESARLLSAKKQENKEKELEKKEPQKKTGGVKETIKKGAGSVFQRVMSAAAAILAGWMIDKLPQILEGIQKAIVVIRRVVDAVSGVFMGIFGALSEFYEGAKNIIGANTSKDLPDAKDVSNEWDSLNEDLKGTEATLNKNIEGTKDQINKFAKERGSRDIEDPNKTPVAAADRHLHGEGATDRPPGLDTSIHAKALHDADEAAIKADVEEQKKVIKQNKEQGIEDNRPAQSAAKTATEKPKLDYNDQTKAVMAEVNKIDHTKYFNNGATIDTEKEAPPVIESPPVETAKAPVAAVGDSTGTNKKIVTPVGLGFDIDGRKIILNPDAARGWTKVLKAAAKDGVDLTEWVTSSYRSPEKQREIIADANSMTPASVETSPHVQGWAVDIATNTPAWHWMKKHGHKYGWRWNTDPRAPVHFDYMQGNPDNNFWKAPGRNDWMQGSLQTGEKVASIQTTSKKTVIPIPINTITKQLPPPVVPVYNTQIKQQTGGGVSILYAMKTLNRAYT